MRTYSNASHNVDGSGRVPVWVARVTAVANAAVVDGPEALVVVFVPEEHEVDARLVEELLGREQVRAAERDAHTHEVFDRVAVLLVAHETRAVHRPVAHH